MGNLGDFVEARGIRKSIEQGTENGAFSNAFEKSTVSNLITTRVRDGAFLPFRDKGDEQAQNDDAPAGRDDVSLCSTLGRIDLLRN